METTFSEELFRNPGKEHRGAPFWAWNGKLDKEVIRQQIDALKEMGFGGYHVHSRIGLNTPYLSPEFMDCVKYANEYGKEKDMLTWLYDEDKWPSGFGGGFVTENVDFRARYLLFSHTHHPNGHYCRNRPAQGRLTEDGDLTLLARYDVTIRDGRLEAYRRLDETDPATENTWYAYEVVAEKQPWFNNAAYVDVLNPEAIRYFLQVVHERYKECLGSEFSKSIPAIFTDEPQFTKTQPLLDGNGYSEAGAVYTRDMDRLFREATGLGYLDRLPEIFWELADGTLSEMNYQYHNFVADRFAQVYAAQLGQWCADNNLMLTGHLMFEDTLERQTKAIGDAMRSYPHFQLPGIDLLANREEYNTAKQAQSVVRQEGKPGITSELYGVTNWDFDFRGHKLQGDWQAALGITTRVPHLAWMYMGGESKRDYPSPIDLHANWYKRYPLIEDHFARVNTALKRGKAQVRVGMLHPIESFWLLYGPILQTGARQQQMEARFDDVTRWLLFNLIDFDFLSEGLLPNQKVWTENGQLHVGQMTYDVVIIPKLLTIRRTTLDILKQFQVDGGKLILLGDLPEYVDAKPSADALALEAGAQKTGYDKLALLDALAPWRDLDMIDTNGIRQENVFYQLRAEGDTKWLFIAHCRETVQSEATYFLQKAGPNQQLRIKGHYRVQYLDTMTGEIRTQPAHWDGEWTVVYTESYAHDSWLFRLTEAEAPEISPAASPAKPILQKEYLPSVNGFRLEEPNTLLLDQASWRLDDGTWNPVEEILKLDDQVRRICGMRLRTDSFPQPWLSGGVNEKTHVVELRFEIDSQLCVPEVALAFEGDEDVQLFWNERPVAWRKGECYVDRMIHKIPLGALQAGKNILRMVVPFGVNTNLEWCYLLGQFGVQVMGRQAQIIPMPHQIGFGDYARQGLAFYGGNLVYEIPLETVAGEAELQLPIFKASLLEVQLDDGPFAPVFMEPYKVKLGTVTAGKHLLRIRAYGSRINQFGQVHNCNEAERYFGPKTWRTSGAHWCYEYRLKPCGVLVAPILRIYE